MYAGPNLELTHAKHVKEPQAAIIASDSPMSLSVGINNNPIYTVIYLVGVGTVIARTTAHKYYLDTSVPILLAQVTSEVPQKSSLTKSGLLRFRMGGNWNCRFAIR